MLRDRIAVVEQHGLKTVAFPAISTGIYRFPLAQATEIAVTEARRFLERNATVEQIIFVCFGQPTYECYVATVTRVVG